MLDYQDIGVKGVLLLTQAIEEDKLLNLERLFLVSVLQAEGRIIAP